MLHFFAKLVTAVRLVLPLFALSMLSMLSMLSLLSMISVDASAQMQKTKTSDTTVYKAAPVEVVIERAVSAATDQTFRAKDLLLLPHNSAQDLLRIVPGLVISQHAGGGKAEQIFLRGFDADHGTDINISVDGAPVNMVSHGHGQGYADLHFIIPETIERVDVVKGPYFASYGDLTTAGAVTFHTADTLANNIAKLEGGLFGTYRGLGLVTTKLGTTHAYAGAEFSATQGYFELPQEFTRLNLIAKTYTPISEQTAFTSTIMTFTSKWNASGQVPDRAVQSGVITPFGSIDPNEGGTTSRTTFQLALEESGLDPITLRASLTDYRFRLFSNFTFFAADSVNGDMIEQTDQRAVLALFAQKKFQYMADGVGMQTSVGANLRYDNVHTALYHDSVRTRLSTTRDNAIKQTNVGVFAEQKIVFSNLTALFGARADYFSFNVENLAVQGAAAQGVVPKGTTTKIVVSPKANLSYMFNDNATMFLNSGFGFHSNDARAAVSNPSQAVVPRAFGAELGARWADDVVAVSAATWMLDLESEFVWIGDEGTTEEAGRSRRIGIDLEARVHPVSWFTVGGNATLSRGRLRDLPEGENYIALAPILTLTSFAVFEFDAFSAALRLRHIGTRPANESYSVVASGYSIVDLNGTVPLTSALDLTMQIENLLNVSWREAQFDTQSRLRSESESVSEIHYTPGTPFNVRLGVGMRF
ncbi:MAG: TonB-dependent receptor [bacterium]|nr:TonB-dependent receptor [bacterium]